jgi:prepilin-type N-terminal cleavage/methylation domain-containing protein
MTPHTRQPATRSQRAFTLVELIVAAIVTGVLAGAVTTALSRLVSIRARTDERLEAVERADMAADRIAIDAMTVVRDHDLTFCRVTVVDSEANGVPRDELLLLVRSYRRVRPLSEGRESAEQEAQYRVADLAGAEGTGLWRRSDHALDRAQDAGGLARTIVPGVVSLGIQAYDGSSWYDVWDSDFDGMPHALRVTVVAKADVDDRLVTATARRIIAIDRVPLAAETLDEDDLEAPGDESGDAPGNGAQTPAGGQNQADGQNQTGGANAPGGGGRGGGR